MKCVKYPEQASIKELLARPLFDLSVIEGRVQPIVDAVKAEGDVAVRRYTAQFDGVQLDDFKVSDAEIEASKALVSTELKEAIQLAYQNIFLFHKKQYTPVEKVETMPGVVCWRKSVGIDKVGLYIPGGTAPLFSTVLMLAIPAQIAGCQEVVLCTPANKEGKVHPAILFAAQLCGIKNVFKIGGSQAIGAMAYGTETVPAVYKIFGPGNQYVTAAKQMVVRDGLSIDMPAGPSEVLVFADESANPAFIASDLLSQAEHGVDSQVVLLTTSERIFDATQKAVEEQLAQLSRKDIAAKALENSISLLVKDEATALSIINDYAPEHLILAMNAAEVFGNKVQNAGSVFLGHYTPESVGDYASGTNHTLPTNGYATTYSGVSLDSFVKKITFQQMSEQGIQKLGPHVELMAAAEELDAHKMAVTLRLEALRK